MTANKISIITPVLREQATIGAFLTDLTNQKPASQISFEIILVDGATDASTIEFVKSDAHLMGQAEQLNCRFFRSEMGRAKQMNLGAREASGDYLLFLHADTLLPPAGLLELDEALQGNVQVAAFDLGFREPGFYFWLTALVGGLRSRLTRKPYGDQGLFIQTELFHTMKGFRELPFLEDLDFTSRLKAAGIPIRIFNKRLRTSARRWQQEGLLRCTFRNWYVAFLFGRGVAPEKLKKYYSFSESVN